MEATARVVVALGRLKGLFLEVPDARLSLAEASRIAGLDSDVCQSILAALEDVRFIKREPDGSYCKRYVDAEPHAGERFAAPSRRASRLRSVQPPSQSNPA
ncbi:MAG: hypothetical protein IT184_11980 [Acidobacteria bacterium]|nr:hypothetical protein [Acidobacteriota bacterium]